jgi:hypothetical protein
MKKQILTIAIIFGLSLTTFAESDNHHGGLFGRGLEPREHSARSNREGTPMLPMGHGLSNHQDADDSVPMGTGIAVLMGLGAAYLVGKKRKED